MSTSARFILVLAGFCTLAPLSAQHAVPPSFLAEDLCACLGRVDPESNNRTFELAVRHCLNAAVTGRSEEMTELLGRHPAQDRRFFLLGLVLGSALDRSCPEYPLVKDRLRLMLHAEARPVPST